MFPTGNQFQTDSALVTVTVPVLKDGDANDFMLDAVVTSLQALARPSTWNALDYTIDANQAALYGQMIVDSLTITWL